MSFNKPIDFNQNPSSITNTKHRKIYNFNVGNNNIDLSVVHSFGEEWKKFNKFSDAEIDKNGNMYFDIIDENIVNKNTYGIDIGCGSGRWTKFLIDKIGFMEAIDPSDAIFMADDLLEGKDNLRLSRASTDNIPFPDETFDFGMSIGVLHHIPNTPKAMADCVKKIKVGGYFFIYLYYSLDNRGLFFKFLLSIVTAIRMVISRLPSGIKKIACDVLAIFVYLPVIILGRILSKIGLNVLAKKLPLSTYQDQTFFIIRNDALDRFGTTLEQRFSKSEIIKIMHDSGLDEIIVSDSAPYWHAVGKRIH